MVNTYFYKSKLFEPVFKIFISDLKMKS